MPRFRYRARTEHGDPLEGVTEAPSAEAAAAQLLNAGAVPVEIEPAPERRGPLAALRERLAARRPGLVDLIMFTRQMYTLTRAGVPIIRAIRGLAESARNPLMARALDDVADTLESGRDLASALGRHPDLFPPLYVSIVHVGESTGRLEEAFEQLARHLELEKDTRDRVKQALRYPAFVLVAMAVALAIVNLMVIPAFAKVYASFRIELPLATRVLIAVSEFTVRSWPWLLAGLVAAAAGVRLWLQSERGRHTWDRWKLRLPVVGDIVLRATLARIARAFAMVQRSGVPVIQGITLVARGTGNAYVAERVLLMRNAIERGESLLRAASATGLFTPLVLQMIAVGEETGAVDELLDEVAGFYEREVDYDLRNLSQTIEPLLIVMMGVLVLVLALGVFLPMWDLVQIARQ